MKYFGWGVGVVGVPGVLFIALLLMIGNASPETKARWEKSAARAEAAQAKEAPVEEEHVKGVFDIGERCRLKGPNGEGAFVAASGSSFNSMVETFAARDEHGRLELMLQNQVVFLSEPTNGIYLKSDWDAFVVRITEGPHEGKKVWIMKAFVHHR